MRAVLFFLITAAVMFPAEPKPAQQEDLLRIARLEAKHAQAAALYFRAVAELHQLEKSAREAEAALAEAMAALRKKSDAAGCALKEDGAWDCPPATPAKK
jgi:hypothetical protein